MLFPVFTNPTITMTTNTSKAKGKVYAYCVEDKRGTRHWLEVIAKSEWEARDKARALCISSGFSLVERDNQNDF